MGNPKLIVFAGSYAELNQSGVYSIALDEETGKLTVLNGYEGLRNPTFVNVDTDNSRLYAISEGLTADGKKTGEAAAYEIAEDGKLKLLGITGTVNGPTCHIQRDTDSKYIIVTSYHAGMVGLSELTADGEIGSLLDVQQHEGSSVHPNQDRPHPHSAFFSPDGRYLLVQDLGLDIVRTYRIDKEQNKLVPVSDARVAAGAGPRHLVFHPSGRYAYVINELNSTVTAFSYDAAEGKLSELQTLSTLPEGYQGENGTAEITISEDGRFVYGSNRGHDSIVVYAVEESSGRLTVIQHISVEGKHPRHFALTPGGHWLLAANRDTNNITTFRVDRDSGKLTYTGHSLEVSKPVCVKPVYL